MSWGWQEIVVAVILVCCIALIGRNIFHFFKKVKKKGNPCESCVSGCDLKRQLDKKRQECASKTLPPKKKCCG